MGLCLPKPAPFEAKTGLELQQMYFVKISKRIALSWDASRGLGDPFCFGFSTKKDTTQERRARGLWKGQPGGGCNTGICHYCDCRNQHHLKQKPDWSFNKCISSNFQSVLL